MSSESVLKINMVCQSLVKLLLPYLFLNKGIERKAATVSKCFNLFFSTKNNNLCFYKERIKTYVCYTFTVDETGKVIRGKGVPSDNYDSYVIDVWKQYYPQPVEPKKASVYDYYDILEEIGA